MRWKLLLIATLLATLVSTGTIIGLVGSLKGFAHPNLFAFFALLVPLAATTYASIFVYRHTARRRRLQAFLTALFTIFLTLTAVIIASAVTARRASGPIASQRMNRSIQMQHK